MPKKIIFTDEQIKEILAFHKGGLSNEDIAGKYGVAKNTIRRVLLDEGVQFSKEATARKISAKRIGKPSTRKGAKHTDETRRKLSESHKGKQTTLGFKFSDESKQKMREARYAYFDRIGLVPKPKPKPRQPKQVKVTKPKRTQEEIMARKAEFARINLIRSYCKRLVVRTLRATGKRKMIPSAQYLGYDKHEFLRVVGAKPSPDHQLDHIVPVVEFIRRGITDPAIINALPNLRFIPAEENRKKSDKVPENADELIAICINQVLIKQAGKTFLPLVA
jgi:hypothetical protein